MAVPAHVPLLALRSCPSFAVPEITGSAVFTGGPVVTVAVAADVAPQGFLPALVAVTTTFSVLPTCALTNRYVDPVAPEMFAQLPPDVLQASH